MRDYTGCQPQAVCFGLSDLHGIYLQTPSCKYQALETSRAHKLVLSLFWKEEAQIPMEAEFVHSSLTIPSRDRLFQVSAGSLSRPPWWA